MQLDKSSLNLPWPFDANSHGRDRIIQLPKLNLQDSGMGLHAAHQCLKLRLYAEGIKRI